MKQGIGAEGGCFPVVSPAIPRSHQEKRGKERCSAGSLGMEVKDPGSSLAHCTEPAVGACVNPLSALGLSFLYFKKWEG